MIDRMLTVMAWALIIALPGSVLVALLTLNANWFWITFLAGFLLYVGFSK